MQGASVIVIRQAASGVDAHGNPVSVETQEAVDDVLVNRVGTSDANDAAAHVEGDTVRMKLAFPKTYQKPLRNCRVIVPMVDPLRQWRVVGDPVPIKHNCPTRWNYQVEVVFNDG